MKILAAEDDRVSRRILERILEDFGYEVISCSNGQQAWEEYKSQQVSFAILDWIMPEMDGPELCRRIRADEEKANVGGEQKQYCYIVMLTVKQEVDDLVVGMSAGADDFITKPFNKKELEVRINAGTRVLNLMSRLDEANAKLRQANQMKSEFVGIVSHDLGTPLTVMRGFTKLLLNRTLGTLNEKQHEVLEAVDENVDHLNKLRTDILDLSKIDLGEFVLDRTQCSAGELVASSLTNLIRLAEEKKQKMKIDVDNTVIVWCDRRKVSQVIENYVSNAIKYTNDGGQIEIEAKGDDDDFHVTVRDNGRGVPKGEQENVFKRFYRVGKKVSGSTGLGLSIVKQIVEAHAGKVWCESEEDKGSTFHFTIPRNEPESD